MKKLFPFTLSFAMSCVLAQAATPIPVTGANVDIIVESYGAGNNPYDFATSFDTKNYSTYIGTGIGFQGNPGLPSSFTSVADPTVEFTLLGSYTQNNALQLLGGETGTLTFVTPSAFSSIYLLTASANGSGTGVVTVTFEGGTTTDVFFTSPDWYTVNDDIAFAAGPVYAYLNTEEGANAGYYGSGSEAPYVYQSELVIPEEFQGLSIQSLTFNVDLTSDSGFSTSILGLSGVVAVPEPTAFALGGAGLAMLIFRRRFGRGNR